METSIYVEQESSISLAKYMLIIVLLAILGLNIFSYLAKTTDLLTSSISKVTDTAKDAINTTIDVSHTGTDKLVDTVAKTAKGSVNLTSGILTGSVKQLDDIVEKRNEKQGSAVADSSESPVQSHLKSGMCYIGMDRGVRSCLEVGQNDTCMSGEIYPSMEICINPQLRA